MKGINNQTCIGPCYPGDKITIHPLYLKPINNDINEKPYCATIEWENKNTKFIMY